MLRVKRRVKRGPSLVAYHLYALAFSALRAHHKLQVRVSLVCCIPAHGALGVDVYAPIRVALHVGMHMVWACAHQPMPGENGVAAYVPQRATTNGEAVAYVEGVAVVVVEQHVYLTNSAQVDLA